MLFALKDANVAPEEITYINAHGTSTHHTDLFETRAIKAAFGEHAYDIKVNSTKSMIGHLLGAAGAVEFIACVLQMNHGYVHQTVGLEQPDEELDLDYVQGHGVDMDFEYALTNSLAFGGLQGRAYVLYPLAGLAEDLQSSISSVTRALRELEAARLIERRSNGFSKPNQIFLGVPRTAQKCAIEMAQNEQPDCSKVSNTVAQNCTPNQINKNNLRLNQLNRTKEAYGRYRNVFLEDYSELEMEIAELDTLIEDLSAYMQSTGRKYADHAATLRSWSARKKRQQKPGAGIPDYTYNEEESL